MYGLLSDFETHLNEKDASPSTVRAYLFDLKKFINWYQDTANESPEVGAVGPLDIAEFKRFLQNRKQKPATINRALRSLNVFFSWAVGNGCIDQNPAEDIKSLFQVKSAPKALERKEQQALMRAVQRSGKERDIAIISLLLHTGLRVSELCSLTMDDVKIGKRSGHLVVHSGKGNKYREVPLNITARKALRGWIEKRGDIPGPLFPGRRGGHITARNVEYMISKYAYDARLEDVTPHVLRHTFCKSLVDAGESLDRVAALAGHSDLNTTAKYTRPTRRDLQGSVDRLAWE